MAYFTIEQRKSEATCTSMKIQLGVKPAAVKCLTTTSDFAAQAHIALLQLHISIIVNTTYQTYSIISKTYNILVLATGIQ